MSSYHNTSNSRYDYNDYHDRQDNDERSVGATSLGSESYFVAPTAYDNFVGHAQETSRITQQTKPAQRSDEHHYEHRQREMRQEPPAHPGSPASFASESLLVSVMSQESESMESVSLSKGGSIVSRREAYSHYYKQTEEYEPQNYQETAVYREPDYEPSKPYMQPGIEPNGSDRQPVISPSSFSSESLLISVTSQDSVSLNNEGRDTTQEKNGNYFDRENASPSAGKASNISSNMGQMRGRSTEVRQEVPSFQNDHMREHTPLRSNATPAPVRNYDNEYPKTSVTKDAGSVISQTPSLAAVSSDSTEQRALARSKLLRKSAEPTRRSSAKDPPAQSAPVLSKSSSAGSDAQYLISNYLSGSLTEEDEDIEPQVAPVLSKSLSGADAQYPISNYFSGSLSEDDEEIKPEKPYATSQPSEVLSSDAPRSNVTDRLKAMKRNAEKRAKYTPTSHGQSDYPSDWDTTISRDSAEGISQNSSHVSQQDSAPVRASLRMFQKEFKSINTNISKEDPSSTSSIENDTSSAVSEAIPICESSLHEIKSANNGKEVELSSTTETIDPPSPKFTENSTVSRFESQRTDSPERSSWNAEESVKVPSQAREFQNEHFETEKVSNTSSSVSGSAVFLGGTLRQKVLQQKQQQASISRTDVVQDDSDSTVSSRERVVQTDASIRRTTFLRAKMRHRGLPDNDSVSSNESSQHKTPSNSIYNSEKNVKEKDVYTPSKKIKTDVPSLDLKHNIASQKADINTSCASAPIPSRVKLLKKLGRTNNSGPFSSVKQADKTHENDESQLILSDPKPGPTIRALAVPSSPKARNGKGSRIRQSRLRQKALKLNGNAKVSGQELLEGTGSSGESIDGDKNAALTREKVLEKKRRHFLTRQRESKKESDKANELEIVVPEQRNHDMTDDRQIVLINQEEQLNVQRLAIEKQDTDALAVEKESEWNTTLDDNLSFDANSQMIDKLLPRTSTSIVRVAAPSGSNVYANLPTSPEGPILSPLSDGPHQPLQIDYKSFLERKPIPENEMSVYISSSGSSSVDDIPKVKSKRNGNGKHRTEKLTGDGTLAIIGDLEAEVQDKYAQEKQIPQKQKRNTINRTSTRHNHEKHSKVNSAENFSGDENAAEAKSTKKIGSQQRKANVATPVKRTKIIEDDDEDLFSGLEDDDCDNANVNVPPTRRASQKKAIKMISLFDDDSDGESDESEDNVLSAVDQARKLQKTVKNVKTRPYDDKSIGVSTLTFKAPPPPEATAKGQEKYGVTRDATFLPRDVPMLDDEATQMTFSVIGEEAMRGTNFLSNQIPETINEYESVETMSFQAPPTITEGGSESSSDTETDESETMKDIYGRAKRHTQKFRQPGAPVGYNMDSAYYETARHAMPGRHTLEETTAPQTYQQMAAKGNIPAPALIALLGCAMMDAAATAVAGKAYTATQDPRRRNVAATMATNQEYDHFSESAESASLDSYESETMDRSRFTGQNTRMPLSLEGREGWDEWNKMENRSRSDSDRSRKIRRRRDRPERSHEWEEWDTKGSGSASESANSDHSEEISERLTKAEDIDRRTQAHEKLLLFAYHAMSIPPIIPTAEKGDNSAEAANSFEIESEYDDRESLIDIDPVDSGGFDGEETVINTIDLQELEELEELNGLFNETHSEAPTMGNSVNIAMFEVMNDINEISKAEQQAHSNTNLYEAPNGNWQNQMNFSIPENQPIQMNAPVPGDGQNQMHVITQDDRQDQTNSDTGTYTSKSHVNDMDSFVSTLASPRIEKPVRRSKTSISWDSSTRASEASARIIDGRQTIDSFCARLRTQGIEVLKLNRDNKWQLRYLTVSKEVTWLHSSQRVSGSKDRGHCPQGIIWLKKFSTTKETSVATIDKQGKGGMLLSQLVSAFESDDTVVDYTLTKRQQEGAFKKRALVVLQSKVGGKARSVSMYCKTREDAQFLCSGCTSITEVLKLDAAAKNRAVRKVGQAQNVLAARELGLRGTSKRGESSSKSRESSRHKTAPPAKAWEV
eukprot:scaffold72447_cov54-Attheya_sp.AAC.2